MPPAPYVPTILPTVAFVVTAAACRLHLLARHCRRPAGRAALLRPTLQATFCSHAVMLLHAHITCCCASSEPTSGLRARRPPPPPPPAAAGCSLRVAQPVQRGGDAVYAALRAARQGVAQRAVSEPRGRPHGALVRPFDGCCAGCSNGRRMQPIRGSRAPALLARPPARHRCGACPQLTYYYARIIWMMQFYGRPPAARPTVPTCRSR